MFAVAVLELIRAVLAAEVGLTAPLRFLANPAFAFEFGFRVANKELWVSEKASKPSVARIFCLRAPRLKVFFLLLIESEWTRFS